MPVDVGRATGTRRAPSIATRWASESEDEMLCQDVMKRSVKCVSERESIHAAAKLMRDENVGFVPVCDDAGKAIGALTDRDIVLRVVANHGSTETPVADVMTRSLVVCSPQERISVAESRMRDQKKSRVVCVDQQGKPVGIISLSDLAQRRMPWRIGRLLRGLTTREAQI